MEVISNMSNTLTLNNLQPEDDGSLYQCGVTNENSTVYSQQGRINSKNYIKYLMRCLNE